MSHHIVKTSIINNFSMAQLEASGALTNIIAQQIAASPSRAIPFSQFMHLALYHNHYGYYAGDMLHKHDNANAMLYTKDFVTSPTLSPLFAQTLSLQLKQIFAEPEMRGVPKIIAEFACGNGQLMLDLLACMGDELDYYYIIELSKPFIALQKRQLQQFMNGKYISKVRWISAIPDGFTGVVIANELIDALPCELIVWQNGTWLQKCVTQSIVDTCNNHEEDGKQPRFNYCNLPIANNTGLYQSIINTIPSCAHYYDSANYQECQNHSHHHDYCYETEINLAAVDFLATLTEKISCGAILLIDYGYGANEYYSQERTNGTIRGFSHHALVEDVLSYPGLIDITSSVNFSNLAKVALSNGCDLIGYTTQANFLINCGITTIAQTKQQKDAFDYLTSPNKMGDIFKVMSLSKNIANYDWLGFASNDKSYML